MSICPFMYVYVYIYASAHVSRGYGVAQLVEVPRHKPEDRGFDSRRDQWNILFT
jgi:hypothetical protein